MVYRQGSLNGASSAVYVLPESSTAIVVLSNFSDLGDTTNWVAQLLLEIVLDAPQPNNYVELARAAAQDCLQRAERINADLANKRSEYQMQEALELCQGIQKHLV